MLPFHTFSRKQDFGEAAGPPMVTNHPPSHGHHQLSHHHPPGHCHPLGHHHHPPGHRGTSAGESQGSSPGAAAPRTRAAALAQHIVYTRETEHVEQTRRSGARTNELCVPLWAGYRFRHEDKMKKDDAFRVIDPIYWQRRQVAPSSSPAQPGGPKPLIHMNVCVDGVDTQGGL